MRETKLKKETRKLVYINLDNIYKASRNIAKEWDSKTVPLKTLEVMVNKSRPGINTGVKELDLFTINYNKMLDKFYLTCVKIAKNMNSKSIPIALIKSSVNLMKKAFKDGQEQ